MIDFMSGIDLAVLSFKDKRDRYYRVGSASDEVRHCCWVVFVVLDAAMIGYTIMFAVSASRNSQYAWFITFIVWLVVEIVFVSTLVALWTHVLLPSFSYAGVKRVEKAVLGHLLDSDNETQEEAPAFNAAAHFFVSHRLATFLAEIDSEAKTAVLNFATVWPREAFVALGIVPAGSEESGLWFRIVLICVSMHHPEHDVLIMTVCSLVMGFITLLLATSYQATPIVALIVVILLCCGVMLIYLSGIYSTINDEDSKSMPKIRNTALSGQQERSTGGKSLAMGATMNKEREWENSVHYHEQGDGEFFVHHGNDSDGIVGGENYMCKPRHDNASRSNSAAVKRGKSREYHAVSHNSNNGLEEGRNSVESQGLQLQHIAHMEYAEVVLGAEDEEDEAEEEEATVLFTVASEKLTSV
jgi:hypothetical protein